MTTFEKLRQALVVAGTDAMSEFVGRDVSNMTTRDVHDAASDAYHSMSRARRDEWLTKYRVVPDDDAEEDDARFRRLVDALLVDRESRDAFLAAAGMSAPSRDVPLALYRARERVPAAVVAKFYAEHGVADAEDKPDVAEVLIIRRDENGSQPSLADVVLVPARLIRDDCSGCAATDYLASVVLEFADSPAGAALREGGREPTWNDLFSVPESFLAPRNVVVKPVEAYATLEVGMDEEVDS